MIKENIPIYYTKGDILKNKAGILFKVEKPLTDYYTLSYVQYPKSKITVSSDIIEDDDHFELWEMVDPDEEDEKWEYDIADILLYKETGKEYVIIGFGDMTYKVKCLNPEFTDEISKVFIESDSFTLISYGFGHLSEYEPTKSTEEAKVPKMRTFPSGAVRSDDTGRPKPTLLSPYALEAIAQHISNATLGNNYWKGIPEEECMNSMLRHYIGWSKHVHEGDEESAKLDLVSVAFNALAALHTSEIKRLGIYTEEQTKEN